MTSFNGGAVLFIAACENFRFLHLFVFPWGFVMVKGVEPIKKVLLHGPLYYT